MRLLIDFKYQLVQELVCAPANIVFLVYSFLDFVFIIIVIIIIILLFILIYYALCTNTCIPLRITNLDLQALPNTYRKKPSNNIIHRGANCCN